MLWLHIRMLVSVLGPLLVLADGRDVSPRGQRLRDVFVVLVQRRGRPVPADVLLDLVWGEQAAEFGVSAVHTAVARLRRRLGPGVITSVEGGYLAGGGIETDEDTFQELLSRARHHHRQGDDLGASRDYRAALNLWRDPEAYRDIRTELVEADRARLGEQRALAIEEFVELLIALPDRSAASSALALTTELISRYPLRERPYQLAMLAAYRCQRQAEALSVYQDLRHRLRTDLGIEPSPAAALLHTQILRQDPSLNGGHPTTPGTPAAREAVVAVTATILPAPMSRLIGRETELTGLLEALAAGRRLITLIGPGGVGKSRLLIELGHRVHRTKEIVYTALSGISEIGPDELAEAIAIGHGFLEPRRSPLDALITALADGNRLLLVDEAESAVVAVADTAQSILEGCPDVQLVVTSRIPLDLPGEFLLPIEPLTCPDTTDTASTIHATPAVQFLIQRLTDRAVPINHDDNTARLLASITRRVDGLPLALELAAGQAAGRSLADIAALVQTPLDVPATLRPRNIRHRTLRDTLEWSINRLDPAHRDTLARLSVFAGPFDLPAARVIAGTSRTDNTRTDNTQADNTQADNNSHSTDTVDGIVRSLAREALVHVERIGSAELDFRLLRTVRDLAIEELTGTDLAVTKARHRRWHADRWRTTTDGLVRHVRDHHDDYLEALRSALDNRDNSTLADLTLTLSEFWRFAGGQTTGLRWISRVLDSGILDSNDRGRVQAQRAALALHHFPDIVLADTAAAIPILEASHEFDLLIRTYSVRAVELYSRGRWDEATTQIDHAVRVARTGNGEPLVKALSLQAMVRSVADDPAPAVQAIAETLSLATDLISPPTVRIPVALNLAFAFLGLERPRDALHQLGSIGADIDLLSAGRPPDFLLLAEGWALLACGAPGQALKCFARTVPTHSPGMADRQSAETYLGVGCALAAIDHPAAGDTIADALELCDRVLLTVPPAFSTAVARARRQIGSPARPGLPGEPTAALLDRLETSLRHAVDPTALDS